MPSLRSQSTVRKQKLDRIRNHHRELQFHSKNNCTVNTKESKESQLLIQKRSLSSLPHESLPESVWNPHIFRKSTRTKQQTQQQHKEASLPFNSHHRRVFDDIAQKLGINTQLDWYLVSSSKISNPLLLVHYKGSISTALPSVYPEYEWDLSQFRNAPLGFLNSISNQRKVLDRIVESVGITQHIDLYQLTHQHFIEHGGSGLLNHYNGNVFNCLKSVYSEFEWTSLLQRKVHKKFWNEINHQKEALDWIASQYGITQQSDWYTLDPNNTNELRDSTLLQQGNNFLYNVLKAVYPQFIWNPLMFEHVPISFWRNTQTHKEIFDLLAEELRIEVQEDWYGVGTLELDSVEVLLRLQYNSSLFNALNSIYPQFQWNSRKFQHFHQHKVADISLRRKFDEVSKALGIVSQQDWYEVSPSKLSFVTAKWKPRLQYLLKRAYPEFEWLPWCFTDATVSRASRKSWNSLHFMEWLKDHYQIDNPLQWAALTHKPLFRYFAKSYGGTVKTLYKFFPEEDWDEVFRVSEDVKNMLQCVVPGIQYGYKLAGGLELDIYSPATQLAFEYQGAQHYKTNTASIMWHKTLHERDIKKRSLCVEKGITLIEVPYWWDRTFSSLIATIHKHKPALMFFDKPSAAALDGFRMNYPQIESIETIRKLITENANITQYNINNMIVFQYHGEVSHNDSIQLYQECNGLKFSEDGQLICRPYHIFTELQESQLSSFQMHWIESIVFKYDGILVTPVRVKDSVMFTSKDGNFIPALVEFMKETPHHYEAFANVVIARNQTPLFEFCSTKLRRTVPCSEDSLVLTAIRDNRSGQYMSYFHMKQLAQQYEIPVAESWNGIVSDAFQLFSMLKSLKKCEGFVIRMMDGNMYKITTNWFNKRKQLKQRMIA